jgi:hypothetical protein
MAADRPALAGLVLMPLAPLGPGLGIAGAAAAAVPVDAPVLSEVALRPQP